MTPQIIIVEKEGTTRELLQQALEKVGYRVQAYQDETQVLHELERGGDVKVIFLDLGALKQKNADFFKGLKSRFPEIHLILTARKRDRNVIKEAIGDGVYGCVYRPYDPEEISLMLRNLFPRRPPGASPRYA